MPHGSHLRSVLLIAIVCLSACRPGICPEAKQVDVAYQGDCLAELVYHKSSADVTISPRIHCPWERLVDLSIFRNFKPGMTTEEARKQFGPPDIIREDNSEQFWEYQYPEVTIVIGHEDQGSGIIPFYKWWTLTAFPKTASAEAIFPPEVASRLPQDGKEFLEIVVLNQCGTPMVIVSIDKGRVREVYWTNNSGSSKIHGL